MPRVFIRIVTLCLLACLPPSAFSTSPTITRDEIAALREEIRHNPGNMYHAFHLAGTLRRRAVQTADIDGSIPLFREESAVLMDALKRIDWTNASVPERSMGYKMLDALASSVVLFLDLDRGRKDSQAFAHEILVFARPLSMEETGGYAPATARIADALAFAVSDMAEKERLFAEAHTLLRAHIAKHPDQSASRYLLAYSLMAASSLRENTALKKAGFEDALQIIRSLLADYPGTKRFEQMEIYYCIYMANTPDWEPQRDYWLNRASAQITWLYGIGSTRRDALLLHAEVTASRGDAAETIDLLNTLLKKKPEYAHRLKSRMFQVRSFLNLQTDPSFAAWVEQLPGQVDVTP